MTNSKIIAMSAFIQMCGGGASNDSNTPLNSDQYFTCDEYQLMLDVELMVAVECTTDAECNQIVYYGEDTCESNSILVSEEYVSEYFYTLYDEAVGFGCNLEFEMNENCSNQEAVCNLGKCQWM